MKKLLSILAGVVALFVAILAIEAAGHAALPPDRVLFAAAAGWFLGPLAGAALALRLSRWRAAPWIVALLAVAAGVANLLAAPHPAWAWAAAVLLPLLAAAVAERLAGGRR